MGGKLSPAGSRVISPCRAVEKHNHIHASLCSTKSAHILLLSAGLYEAKYVWKANRFLVLIWEALLRNDILHRQLLLSQFNCTSIIFTWEINVTVALLPVRGLTKGKVIPDVEKGDFSLLDTALMIKKISIFHSMPLIFYKLWLFVNLLMSHVAFPIYYFYLEKGRQQLNVNAVQSWWRYTSSQICFSYWPSIWKEWIAESSLSET